MPRFPKRIPKDGKKPFFTPFLRVVFVLVTLCFTGMLAFVWAGWQAWSSLLHGGFSMQSYASTPHSKSSENSKSRKSRKSSESRKSAAPDCARANQKSIRGAFRELNCRISWRRTILQRSHPEDLVIRRLLLRLHNRLRTQAKSWRTIYHWQTLYKLGTRIYPLKNRWAANAVIPVYEVNGHHKSLPFWIKEALRRKVGPLFHLDAHADMESVPSAQGVLKAIDRLRHNRDVKQAWHTIAHSIRHCGMPVSGGVLSGAYNRVIWGTPSWIKTVEFVNQLFFFAIPRRPNPIPPDIFPGTSQIESGVHPLFAPDTKGLPPGASPSPNAPGQKWEPAFQLYYDPLMNKGRPLAQDGEYWHRVTAKRRPYSKHFTTRRPIHFSVLMTDLHIDKHGTGTDAEAAKKLLEAIPKGVFTLDLDLDYFGSIDLDASFMRTPGEHPSWNVHTFTSQRAVLARRLRRFRTMLLFLQANERLPALITLADSTFLDFAFNPVAEGQSEYTPLEHAAFVRQQVRKLLREVYQGNINGRQHSKRPSLASSPTLKRKPMRKSTRELIADTK